MFSNRHGRVLGLSALSSSVTAKDFKTIVQADITPSKSDTETIVQVSVLILSDVGKKWRCQTAVEMVYLSNYVSK